MGRCPPRDFPSVCSQQEQQESPPLQEQSRLPLFPQQQKSSSRITMSQMQEQLLLSKDIFFTSLT